MPQFERRSAKSSGQSQITPTLAVIFGVCFIWQKSKLTLLLGYKKGHFSKDVPGGSFFFAGQHLRTFGA
jgi:hypothetical protein